MNNVVNNHIQTTHDVSNWPSVIVNGTEFVRYQGVESARSVIKDLSEALENIRSRGPTILPTSPPKDFAVYTAEQVLTKHAAEIERCADTPVDTTIENR